MERHRFAIFAIILSILILAGCCGQTQTQENTQNQQENPPTAVSTPSEESTAANACPAGYTRYNGACVADEEYQNISCADSCSNVPNTYGSLESGQCLCHCNIGYKVYQRECISQADYEQLACDTQCKAAHHSLGLMANDSCECASCEPEYRPYNGNCITDSEYDQIIQSQECPSDYPVKKDYSWEYGGKQYTLPLCFPEVGIETWRSRSRERNYANFVDDPYSNKTIELLSNDLERMSSNEGFDQWQKVTFTIAFVQGLPYTSDKVTTGYDNYPRFPYETLYDDGGDCEDTAILAAALLKRMGYGVILLNPPKHMAVGLRCTPDSFSYPVTYYTYQGNDYCYLETAGDESWKIGQLPHEYDGVSVNILPIYSNLPELTLDPYKYHYSYNSYDTYVDVTGIKVTNLGTGTAKNVKIYVALQTADTSKVWDQYTIDAGDISVDGSYSGSVTNLHAPGRHTFRVQVIVYGDNFNKIESTNGWITWS